MGAGKSHVINWMSEKGFFPLPDIVQVHPASRSPISPLRSPISPPPCFPDSTPSLPDITSTLLPRYHPVFALADIVQVYPLVYFDTPYADVC